MPQDTENTDTVIVGGGQSGLAMSYLLTRQDRDHLVLEKGERIGDAWQDKWDSFTLVTPNWALQLPGHSYEGDDPGGFLPRDEIVTYLEGYAASFDPPISFGTKVTSVERAGDGNGFVVHTPDRAFEADNVVVAAGTFQSPKISRFGRKVPGNVVQLHSSDYSNPASLPDGGVLVVGSGQSGCQIAWELHRSGRDVYLATGSARRLPRRYRGKDGMWWAQQIGLMEQTVDQLEDPAERFAANPHVSGRDGGMEINLHRFARDGITLLGRLDDIRDGKAVFADDLHHNLAAADAMASEFRKGVDQYVAATGLDVPPEDVDEPTDGFDQDEIPELNLSDGSVGAVIWATGFGWDFGWVDFPVFDDDGYPIQDQGVTDVPGLYFLGMHFLHTRKSGLFLGVGDDAVNIAADIAGRSH